MTHRLADKNLITIHFRFEECGTKKRLAHKEQPLFYQGKQKK